MQHALILVPFFKNTLRSSGLSHYWAPKNIIIYYQGAYTREEDTVAEGRFRYAYLGVYTAPPDKAGKNCVMKRKKETYIWNRTNLKETQQIQDISKKLAVDFNQYSKTDKPVKFVDVEVVHVKKVGSSTKDRLYEWVTTEDYIPGAYMKWCNNYGAIDTSDRLMPAFVH